MAIKKEVKVEVEAKVEKKIKVGQIFIDSDHIEIEYSDGSKEIRLV